MITIPLEALDGLDDGVVKVDRNGGINFANAKFCEMAGVGSWQGLNIRDLFLDEASYIVVEEHLRKRLDDLVAERYQVHLTRPDDSSKVRVEIIAFPDTDRTGTGIGSVAIVRDISVEEPIKSIHECIETEREWRKMFQGVAEVVKEVLPFDWFSVALYSEDGKHVRELYSHADEPLPEWDVRWYEMPPIVLRLIETKKPRVIRDLKEFLSKPGWESVLEDPTTRQFLQLGYQSCLWYPVLQEDKIVAAITLYKKSVNGFADHHKPIMEALPLRRAVAMGLHHLQRRDLEFRLGLIKEIAAGSADEKTKASAHTDIERVADFLVRSIKKHYGWSNVSLFHVQEGRRQFALIAEDYENESYSFRKGYRQKIEEGVLGCVFENRASVRSGNVYADPMLKGRFKKGMQGDTLSELAIPVMVGNKVCAILNSEDKRKNAYAAEEQRALQLVLGEVATIYRRIELEQLLSAILDSARDTVIRTDGDGLILWVNPSATKLLAYPEDRLVGTSLGDYLADQTRAEFFLRADGVPNNQMVFSCGDGTTRNVLVSGSSLPEEIGGRVYIASDMSQRKRTERLGYLKTLYHEIAMQTQVPLSLCFSWLRRLSKRVEDAEAAETLTKVIRQLEKAQLTFDRLSVFERDGSEIPYNPVLLDLEYILSGVRDEMPRREAEHIAVEGSLNDLPPIRGDLFQLAFCLKSTLSYLTRFVPPEGKIRVSGRFADGEVRIVVCGVAPELSRKSVGPYADEQWSSHTLLELALGKDMLKRFLENHGGSFEGPERIGEEVAFRFSVPAVAGDTTQ